MKSSTSKSTVITQVLLAVVAGALGYLLCGGLIVVGIVSIFSYFFSGDFKRIDRFGFALGVMLILLGCIGFIQMDKLTANFDMYTGLLALILGVLTLQGTVQVKVLDYAAWVLNLVLTIISIAGPDKGSSCQKAAKYGSSAYGFSGLYQTSPENPPPEKLGPITMPFS